MRTNEIKKPILTDKETISIDYKQKNKILVEKRKRRERLSKVVLLTGCSTLMLGLTLFCVCVNSHVSGNDIPTVEQTAEASIIYEPISQEAPVEETPIAFTEVIEHAEPDISSLYSNEIIYLAKTVYGEAGGCTKTEQAAVVWNILNRVDSDLRYMPDDIIGVITQKHQYVGYNPKHPVTDEIVELVEDVLSRWTAEKNGEVNVGRILPKEYLWFYGDGKHNHFTDEWRNGNKWDWSLESPYEL